MALHHAGHQGLARFKGAEARSRHRAHAATCCASPRRCRRPPTRTKRAELADHRRQARGHVRQGQVVRQGQAARTRKDKKQCKDLQQLSDVLAKSRNYDELLDAWKGWHSISTPMRPLYERLVELSNEGAKEIGFADLGELWRSRLRHVARGLREGDRSAVEPGEAALRRAALLRARAASRRSTARTRCPPAGPSPRTCSATCGRRSGTTSTRWSSRTRARPAST